MAAVKRIALVGAGNMGANHARVITQSDSATVSLLVDPREDVGRPMADRLGATWAPELPDLHDIDAVVIAAATEAHHPLAMAVLSQDRPLLIEKPVADDLLHTKEILALAEDRDVPIMCGLLERYNPAVLTARAALEEPVHVTATRHSPYAPRIRTGVAWDLLVHDVDLAINIIGSSPSSVDSRLGFFHPSSAAGAEDVAETLLGFQGGAVARISASRVGQHKIRTLSIYELGRLIEVDLLRRDVTIYRHVSEDSIGDGPAYRQQTIIEIPEIITSTEPLTAQFARFNDVIDGRVSATDERATILPSHEVVDHVIAQKVAM